MALAAIWAGIGWLSTADWLRERAPDVARLLARIAWPPAYVLVLVAGLLALIVPEVAATIRDRRERSLPAEGSGPAPKTMEQEVRERVWGVCRRPRQVEPSPEPEPPWVTSCEASDDLKYGRGVLLTVQSTVGDEYRWYRCTVTGPDGESREAISASPGWMAQLTSIGRVHYPGKFGRRVRMVDGTHLLRWHGLSGMGWDSSATFLAKSSFHFEEKADKRSETPQNPPGGPRPPVGACRRARTVPAPLPPIGPARPDPEPSARQARPLPF